MFGDLFINSSNDTSKPTVTESLNWKFKSETSCYEVAFLSSLKKMVLQNGHLLYTIFTAEVGIFLGNAGKKESTVPIPHWAHVVFANSRSWLQIWTIISVTTSGLLTQLSFSFASPENKGIYLSRFVAREWIHVGFTLILLGSPRGEDKVIYSGIHAMAVQFRQKMSAFSQ